MYTSFFNLKHREYSEYELMTPFLGTWQLFQESSDLHPNRSPCHRKNYLSKAIDSDCLSNESPLNLLKPLGWYNHP
jgi:hypothetical protein